MARAKTTATITLDGSGNAAVVTALPTGRLVGIFVDLGTATSVPYTLANMGRNIIAETLTSDTFRNVDELIRKADGTASTAYGGKGAVVHGNLTFTVASGTAGGTLTVTYIYE